MNLDFQNAAAPTVGEGFTDVDVPVGRVFQPLQELENMAPRQLRNSSLRNWTIGEFPGEYFHRQQIARGEAAHVREGFFQVGGETVNDFGTPSQNHPTLADLRLHRRF